MATPRGEAKVHALKALVDRIAPAVSRSDIPPQMRQLYLQLSHLSDGASALFNLARDRDPTITNGEHVKRVAKAADKYARETTAVINASIRHLNSGLEESDARIRAKTRLNPDAYAQETRAAFRAFSPTQQAATLSQLIAENRGPELAALVCVPGMLSGLTDKQRTDYEAAFIAKHALEEVELQSELRSAHEHVLVATKTGYQLAQEFVDPVVLAEIAKAENAANAAAAAFADATMGSR